MARGIPTQVFVPPVFATPDGTGIVVERPEILARHLDTARGRAFETARHHHQARLAGTRRPDQCRNFARRQVTVPPAHRAAAGPS